MFLRDSYSICVPIIHGPCGWTQIKSVTSDSWTIRGLGDYPLRPLSLLILCRRREFLRCPNICTKLSLFLLPVLIYLTFSSIAGVRRTIKWPTGDTSVEWQGNSRDLLWGEGFVINFEPLQNGDGWSVTFQNCFLFKIFLGCKWERLLIKYLINMSLKWNIEWVIFPLWTYLT